MLFQILGHKINLYIFISYLIIFREPGPYQSAFSGLFIYFFSHNLVLVYLVWKLNDVFTISCGIRN